jgi:hypothetical protein
LAKEDEMAAHDVIQRIEGDPEYGARLRAAAQAAAKEPFGQGEAWATLLQEFAVTEGQITVLPSETADPEGWSAFKTTTTITTTVSPETTTTTTTTTLSKMCK